MTILELRFDSVVLINLDWLLLEHSHAWGEADLCALNAIGSLSRRADRVICCHRRPFERVKDDYRPSPATRQRRNRWRNAAFSHTAYAGCDRYDEQRSATTARLEPLIERLRGLGYRCVAAPGHAADDVIATLVVALRGLSDEVRIASGNPRLDPLITSRVRIEMLDPPSVDAFIERQDRWRSAECERSQVRDWDVLERSLRRLFRTQQELQDEVRRILCHHHSLIELDAQLRTNPLGVVEFFANRPEVLAHLVRNRERLETDLNRWRLATDAPIDIAEALEKAAAQMPSEAELALLAGAPWQPPTPEQNFDELPLASFPDIETMLRRRASKRGRIQFLTRKIDGKPALLLDRGESVQLTLGRPPGPPSAVRIFSSTESRGRHLEHLWRYGDL